MTLDLLASLSDLAVERIESSTNLIRLFVHLHYLKRKRCDSNHLLHLFWRERRDGGGVNPLHTGIRHLERVPHRDGYHDLQLAGAGRARTTDDLGAVGPLGLLGILDRLLALALDTVPLEVALHDFRLRLGGATRFRLRGRRYLLPRLRNRSRIRHSSPWPSWWPSWRLRQPSAQQRTPYTRGPPEWACCTSDR